MKALPYLFAAVLLCSPVAGHSTQTAQARLYCLSFHLSQGMDQYGDALAVTSTGTPNGDNEVVPLLSPGSEIPLPGTSTYATTAFLYDVLRDDTFSCLLSVNLPLLTDEDGNNYPDFFEVSRPYSGTGYSGSYSIPGYNGSVTATFTRAAGSRTGTCRLGLQNFGVFLHTFEILEYTGPLTYTPGKNPVSGTLNLIQTGNSVSTMQGPVRFFASSNPASQLTLQPGSLTTDLLPTSTFTNHVFYRDVNWPSNYYGYLEFDNDGNQSSFCPYSLWVLSITDTNDVNHDWVPDFGDVPLPARPPQLSLTCSGNTLELTIRGDVGHLHQVQEATSLTSPNWQTVSSVTLTNDPQTVTLPLPGNKPQFWRVLAQ